MLDTLFQTANLVALVGWLALLVSPWAPRWADRIGGFAIPVVLSLGYVTLLIAFWGSGDGGFSTFDGVAALFSSREVLLAGWVYYLAFDLFVGGWEVREARRRALPFAAVVPCLVLTFLAGPLGLALFLLLRRALRGRAAVT